METKSHNKLLGIIGLVWGVTGFSYILGRAICRLAGLAVESFEYEWSGLHWAAFIVGLIFMGYSEGYKGFQKKYSPRVAARAKYLYEQPSLLNVLLAPLFVMCFYHATRKRIISTWILTAMIVGIVLLVHQTVQPWRGIIDAGVVFGLSWGLLATYIFLIKAFTDKTFNVSPELPVARVAQPELRRAG